MGDSTVSSRHRKADKPAKPYKEFPLFPHATRRWAKKIRGKTVYFGSWDDPDAALAKYLEQKDDLHAGRSPRTRDGVDIRHLCNAFLTSKERLLDSGELTAKSFKDYYATCTTITGFFGNMRLVEDLRPSDFGRLRARLAKTRGPVALGNEINRMRIVFKFAIDSELTHRTIRYGREFDKPSRKTVRKHQATAQRKTFERDELLRLLASADPIMKAMLLLGLNCGFGQTDIANLPIVAVDLDQEWIDYPRIKTGVPRRIPLWPETAEAIRTAIPMRPDAENKADDGLVFLSPRGLRCVRSNKNAIGSFTETDAIGQAFRRLIAKTPDVENVGFYGLRHTHRTVSDGAKDQPAANAIMGHVAASNDMSAVYRESIEDDRLRAVVEHVRKWLWPKARAARKRKAR